MVRAIVEGQPKVWALGLLVLIVMGMMIAAKPAHADTFTVTNALDSGAGSLRQAIVDANNNRGADTIKFNISGAGVKTISPLSELPTITGPLTIDGYTQPGSRLNSRATGALDAVILIELDGIDIQSGEDGLQIDASNVVVRGLVIRRFITYGINIVGGTGVRIEGNFIGTDASGTLDRGNAASGVNIESGNKQTTVGGTRPEARNLISGNNRFAVEIDGAGGNKVQGNLMGTQKNGTTIIGGAQAGVFTESPNNTVGGAEPAAGNVIAFNFGDGVEVAGSSAFSVTGNRILSNSIFSNGGLGIDLDSDGRTPNDPNDPDSGPNNRHNFPELATADKFSSDRTVIEGTLDSTPSTKRKKRTFTIQVFANPLAVPSSFDEGRTFLGQTRVTTNRQGKASFSFETSRSLAVGDRITATATGSGDTSEFSDPVVVDLAPGQG
jgi:hypothetical protein